MATTTMHSSHGVSIFSRVWDKLMAMAEYSYQVSEGARCARQAAELSQLSDAELAARGLKRHNIVAYAFRNHVSI